MMSPFYPLLPPHLRQGPLPGPFPASRALTMSMTATLLPNGGGSCRHPQETMGLLWDFSGFYISLGRGVEYWGDRIRMN